MNVAMNCVSIVALLIIIGCVSWTTWNKKNHPEKYRNERGNAFHILFGDFSRRDQYNSNAKTGHTSSFADAYNEARIAREQSRDKLFNQRTQDNGEEQD